MADSVLMHGKWTTYLAVGCGGEGLIMWVWVLGGG